MARVNRKRVKCHIQHFRVMNNTFISDKWMKMPEAMFSTHLSVSAKLVRRLNLTYCLSLCDSSFGPEGQKRELLDLRKRASAKPATVKTFFYHMKLNIATNKLFTAS